MPTRRVFLTAIPMLPSACLSLTLLLGSLLVEAGGCNDAFPAAKADLKRDGAHLLTQAIGTIALLPETPHKSDAQLPQQSVGHRLQGRATSSTKQRPQPAALFWLSLAQTPKAPATADRAHRAPRLQCARCLGHWRLQI